MKNDLSKKLEGEIQEASFDMLLDHYVKKILIEISGLDLLEVAVAVATDDSDNVKKWLDEKKLIRSEDLNVDTYKKNNQKFKFLIIQPYVLVKQIDG